MARVSGRSKSVRYQTVGAACLLIGASASSARAEDTLRVADPGSFYEAYLDSAPPATRGAVVGAAIVGIRLGASPRTFDPDLLRIALGPSVPSQTELCVKVVSRDGRYFARAKYKLDASAERSTRVELRSKYREKLAGYSTSDMAISAMSAKSCAATKDLEFHGANYDSSSPAKEVVVQVRAGDARLRAQLGFENNPVGPPVICSPLREGPTIGFSAECTLPLPANAKPGKYQLSLGETGSTGEIVVKTYSLGLQPNAVP